MEQNHDANKLASFRKRKKLSQAQLASRLGVSQATISRIEKGEYEPDLKTYAKLAQELEVDLHELVSQDKLDRFLERDSKESFYVFCSNPFCDSNEYGRRDDGKPYIRWKSGTSYPIDRFGEINFCRRCGSDLLKECPRCKRLLEERSKFCVSCGAQITERPNQNDWAKIEKLLPVKPIKKDDIPF